MPGTRRRSPRCYVETDRDAIDEADLARVIQGLDASAPAPGYVHEVFARQARYLQPHNAARIDAIRDIIDREWRGHPYEPILLTSLIEAADRVDSTTGVQMAYVKQWAPRSQRPMRLRMPALQSGRGHAVHGDACEVAARRAHYDLAYLDPPYNQHRYTANYHVWETLVAWDAPAHYGVACKRDELRDPATRSVFNSRRTMPTALHQVIDDLDTDLLIVSCSNEGWVGVDELRAWCEQRGHVDVVGFDSRRYVGAQIGVFNPQGSASGRGLALAQRRVPRAVGRPCPRAARRSVQQRAHQRVDIGQRFVGGRGRSVAQPLIGVDEARIAFMIHRRDDGIGEEPTALCEHVAVAHAPSAEPGVVAHG